MPSKEQLIAEKTKKKCVLYLRVSTDMQELENQRIALREFAKKKGYDIYKEYSDIMTGTYKSRPAFNNLFNDVHKGLFDVVIFWDLSRFSRSGTLYTIQKLEQLERLGVDYISYQEPYINSIGEFKDVLLALLSTIAKIERRKMSERTKAGLQRLRKKGKTLGRPKGSQDKKKRNRSCWKKHD